MLTDIFSFYDTGFTYTFVFWSLFIMVISIMLSKNYYFYPSLISLYFNKITGLFKSKKVGILLLFAPIYLIIVILNLAGNIPYVFPFSTEAFIPMLLGIPVWFAFIFSSAMYSPKFTFGSLLPGGVPLWMAPFLALVELISVLARPLTLCLRLIANICAGHIFVSLLSMVLCKLVVDGNLSMLLVMGVSMGLNLFELAVSIIQTTIFTLLLSMYSADHV